MLNVRTSLTGTLGSFSKVSGTVCTAVVTLPAGSATPGRELWIKTVDRKSVV